MNIEILRQTCLSFPSAGEDVKWGSDLCFVIAGKMFCVTGLEGPFRVSFKTTPDRFDELAAREGILPAPYLARNHWVQVKDAGALDEAEWTYLLRASYDLVRARLPKSVQAGLG